MELKKTQIQFASLAKRPVTQPVASGSPIYEWSYFDKQGELHEDSRNVQEQIESYKKQVDYKAKIRRGEEFNSGTGIYMDTTSLGDDPIAIQQYISDVRASLQKDLEEFYRQRESQNEVTATISQSLQNSPQGNQNNQESNKEGEQQ